MSDFNLILDGKVILLIWVLLTAVEEVTCPNTDAISGVARPWDKLFIWIM